MQTHARITVLSRAALLMSITLAACVAPHASAQTRPVAANTEEKPSSITRVAPARPTIVAPVEMTPVQNAGAVVRVAPGMRSTQVMELRDDQTIETPSGHRMRVADYRHIQAMFTNARAHANQPRAAAFAILPAPTGQGVPRRPGESATQLLARPSTDVILLSSGRSVSVAQLRAIAPYVEQHYGIRLNATSVARPNLSGPATRIGAINQLKSVSINAPDSTILESSNGTRVTVGEVRTVLRAQRPVRRKIDARGGAQQ